MIELYRKKKGIKLVETIFDALYLLTVFTVGLIMVFTSNPLSVRWLFGIMSFILGVGDSFHLLPRIAGMWDKRQIDRSFSLGLGKLIASITMSIFYLILFEIARMLFLGSISKELSILVYLLIIMRIIFCLFKGNKWFSNEFVFSWTLIRNIPFFILGLIIVVVYLAGSLKYGLLNSVWYLVLLSFVFYFPVVFFAHKNSKLGMLMLLKSCAYAAILVIACFN